MVKNWEFPQELSDEVILDFVDDHDVLPAGFVEKRVSEVLEQYTPEEILEENGIELEELIGFGYENGYIGLPEILSDEDALQDLQEEAEDA